MTRDDAYTELGDLGHTGALEDRLLSYLSASSGETLEDKIYSEDPAAGGLDNWLGKQLALSSGEQVTFGGEGVTFGGVSTTW